MARPKEFDTAKVLERAMLQFWAHGYEATSIEDLVEVTGIKRGSIYAAFGDKEGLFLAALDRYSETVASSMVTELTESDPERAIKWVLESIVRSATRARKHPPGCLLTNTALECSMNGDLISGNVQRNFKRIESAMYTAVRRAQSAGSLAPTRDAKRLARFFFGVVQGLNVMNKAGTSPEVLKDMAKVALNVWHGVEDAPRGPGVRKRTASSSPRRRSRHRLSSRQ
jgi:TetR/AcrR family transcriptional regulator, transcriptional repressor for nem operon